ncbi:MAG: DUF6141 family protein [bacterium]
MKIPVEKDLSCSETQYFRQIWLILLMLATSALFLYAMYEQFILGVPFGDKPMPDNVLIIFSIIFGLIFPAFIFSLHLITQVRKDGLYIRFVPLHPSFVKIEYTDIVRFETVTYSPIFEYGGWGIRYGIKGKAYNVSGNRGVRLMFNNGRHILIGSQRAEELAIALQNAKSRINA